ncbi:unnamed protein product [Symbiodinium microadriaticum]|nr:unnamed protein product [Symbiodinium microadriaticum]CAE7874550.1 unnamed protein product [Symbiodinium sp. KB8]
MGKGWKTKHAGQKEPKEDLGGQFPEYDKAWKRAPGIAVLQSSNTPKENHGGLVPTMQNVVNQARKVETKLARLRDEQLQRTRGWEIYLADVKQRVSKEKSKHEAAQQRLSKEISDLEAAQIAVYEQVTEVALQSQRQGLQPLQAAPAATQSMDVDLGLESPMENDLPPDVDLASELQRSPFHTDKETHGLAGHDSLFDEIPQEWGRQVSGFVHGPPGSAHFGGERSTPPPAPAPVRAPEVIPISEGDGHALESAKASPLADQLQAKRKEQRESRSPFGRPERAEAPSGPAPETGQISLASIVDDDNEELDSAHPTPTSPGLGRLDV